MTRVRHASPRSRRLRANLLLAGLALVAMPAACAVAPTSYGMGLEAMKENRPDDAIEQFRRALRGDRAEQARAHLARLFLDRAEREVRTLPQEVALPPEVARAEDQARRVRDDASECRALLAEPSELAEQERRAGEARARELEKLAAGELKRLEAIRVQRSQQHLDEARAFLDQGRFAKAAESGRVAEEFDRGSRGGALAWFAAALSQLRGSVRSGDFHEAVGPLRLVERWKHLRYYRARSQPIRELLDRAREMRARLASVHVALFKDAVEAGALGEAWAQGSFLRELGVRCAEHGPSLEDLTTTLRKRCAMRMLVATVGADRRDSSLLARALELLREDRTDATLAIRTIEEAELAGAASYRPRMTEAGGIMALARHDGCSHVLLLNLIEWVRDENDRRQTKHRRTEHHVDSDAVEQLIALNTLGIIGDMDKTVVETINYQVIDWSRWVSIQVELSLTDLAFASQIDRWIVRGRAVDQDREVVVLSGTGVSSDPKQLDSHGALERACVNEVAGKIAHAVRTLPRRTAKGFLAAADRDLKAGRSRTAIAKATRAFFLMGRRLGGTTSEEESAARYDRGFEEPYDPARDLVFHGDGGAPSRAGRKRPGSCWGRRAGTPPLPATTRRSWSYSTRRRACPTEQRAGVADGPPGRFPASANAGPCTECTAPERVSRPPGLSAARRLVRLEQDHGSVHRGPRQHHAPARGATRAIGGSRRPPASADRHSTAERTRDRTDQR